MTKPINDGGPAFPVANMGSAEPNTVSESRAWARGGLTVRDYFAAKVMAALVGSASGLDFGTGTPSAREHNDKFAYVAYSIADAMIKERQA
jgi:hypothetical protein